MRKIVLIAAVAIAFAACNGKPAEKKEVKAEKAEKAEVVKVSVDQFFEKGEELVGKTILVEGTVDHVCKHGGKRMFFQGSTPENRLKITTGENIASFDVAYEGNTMVVEGIVEMMKMDAEYLDNWEAELKESAEKDVEHAKGSGDGMGSGEGDAHEHAEGDGHDHDHSSLGEKADMGEHIPGMDKVTKYREEIKNTEKGYIPIFSVVAAKVETKK
jgi:hypothetical protein